jgi:Rad3-related DNA helicase
MDKVTSMKPIDFGIPNKSELRQYQQQAIIECSLAFSQGAVRVGLSAPCGSGKTLISAAIGNWLEIQNVYTCQDHGLQAQFLSDFEPCGAVKLLGRRNYLCIKHPARNCELCTWQQPDCIHCLLARDGCVPDPKGNCPCRITCTYEEAKRAALSAKIPVLNTPYLLTEMNYGGAFSGRELVTLDEADLTESALMSFIEIRISDAMAAKYHFQHPRYKTVVASWQEWAENTLKIVETELQRLQGCWVTDDLYAQLQLQRLYRKLTFFMLEADENWVWDAKTDTFRPIRVAKYAQQFLWRHSRRWLLMSATLEPWNQLLSDLGVENG